MLLSLIRSQSFDFFSVIIYILSVLMIIFLVNPLHECAHGFVAYKLGDRTAKNAGRLTLNPISHIDYLGAATMLLIGFGWAKPVPVNSRNFKRPRLGMALTALAGPLSNLLAAVLGGLLSNGLWTILVKTGHVTYGQDIFGQYGFFAVDGFELGWLKYVFMFLQFFMLINICLAVFNLIPVPPLDGSKILMAFLPAKAVFTIYQYERYISMVLFVLIIMGGVGDLIYPIQMWFYNGINHLTELPFSWAW